MNIDMNNYEAFFLDYVEGRLDNSSTLDLLAFLRKHPDLKVELEDFTQIKLNPSSEAFGDITSLKKFDFKGITINKFNFNDYCIAYYEKLLSPDESARLFKYLEEHPESNNDFQLYGKLNLVPDSNVIFEAKPFLKKKLHKIGFTGFVFRWTSVAAGIALLVSVYIYWPHKRIVPAENIIASRGSIITEHERKESPAPQDKKIINSLPEEVASLQKEDSISEHEDKIVREPAAIPLEPIAISNIENDYETNRVSIDRISQSVNETSNDNGEFELMEYAQKLVEKKIFNKKKPGKSSKIGFWDIAEATVKGYNQLSESDITLHHKTDENGKLTVLAVETENRTYGFSSKEKE